VVLALLATGMGAVDISGVKGQKKAPCRKARGFFRRSARNLTADCYNLDDFHDPGKWIDVGLRINRTGQTIHSPLRIHEQPGRLVKLNLCSLVGSVGIQLALKISYSKGYEFFSLFSVSYISLAVTEYLCLSHLCLLELALSR
jgi:hypothetical protein